MGEIYKRYYDIGARAMTPGLRVAASDVFDILQELATLHSDDLGFNMSYFAENQKGWAILNWSAEFKRLPTWREKIKVETWATSYERLTATRNFKVTDESGDVIMKALSKWVLMDIARKRPVKAPSEMMEKYFCAEPNVIADDKVILPRPDESQKIGSGNFIVKRSQTDSNFHVNNVKYIIWAEDDLPDEIFRDCTVKNMHVIYRKECRVNTEACTTMYKLSEKEYLDVITDKDGSIFSEVYFKYE